MQCPQCEESTEIICLGDSSTLLAWSPSYDEEGEYHQHDPNVTTSSWQCNGCDHVWEQKKQTGCWCGWPNNTEHDGILTVDED